MPKINVSTLLKSNVRTLQPITDSTDDVCEDEKGNIKKYLII